MPIFNRAQYADEALTITAGAYSAGDVVGGLITFDVASAGGGGLIRAVIIADDDNEKAACKLHLFSAPPTSIADNAAFAPVIADLLKYVGVITIAAADYTTINGNAVAVVNDVNIDYATENGKLYGYLVCDATPTYTATTDLAIRLMTWRY